MLDLIIIAIVIFIVGTVLTIIFDKRKSFSSSERDSLSRTLRTTSNYKNPKMMNMEEALKLLESRIKEKLKVDQGDEELKAFTKSLKKKPRKKTSSKKRKNAGN